MLLTAIEVVRLLDLKPLQTQGGMAKLTYAGKAVEGGKATSTAIYYLLSKEHFRICTVFLRMRFFISILAIR